MPSTIISSQPTAADTLRLDVKGFNFQPESRQGCGRQCSNSSFLSRHRIKFGTLILLLSLSISAAVVLLLSDVFQESGNTGGLGLWKRVASNTQNNSFVNHKCEWGRTKGSRLGVEDDWTARRVLNRIVLVQCTSSLSLLACSYALLQGLCLQGAAAASRSRTLCAALATRAPAVEVLVSDPNTKARRI